MTDRIIAILRRLDIPVWRVTEKHSETAELYFIRKALDIPRLKELTRYSVQVFRDFERDGKRFRGSTNALLSPGMRDDEIEDRIRGAYYAASYVRNAWFELPAPVKEPHRASDSDLAAMEPADAAMKLAEGLFAVDTDSDAFLNSVEIFVTKSATHILASNGLDVSFDECSVSGELVAQCITPKDVEQFRSFEYDTLDIAALQQRAGDVIRDVRIRARCTQPPKAGCYDILLTGEHIAELFTYYATRSGASMIYPGYSQWKPGMAVQGEEIQGEKLNLTLMPIEPFSAEGIPMIRRPLIENGVMKTIHGGARFCWYLGTEPTGDYDRLLCENGTVPMAQLQGEGVLEPISFSDFQMDYMDGHFKGEIRLALLHHADGSVEELAGGSINGSLTDAQTQLVFSTERYADRTYEGPLAVRIPGVQVAGL